VAHVDLVGLWLEASVRLVETYDVELEPGWRIALDRQPYGEVVQILSGRCRFSLGGEHRDLGPKQIGVLLPGPERVTADVGPEPLRLRGFGFRVELFGAIELSGLLGLPLAIAQPWPDLVDRLAEAVHWGRVGGPAEAFRARAHAELATASLVEHVGEVRELGGRVRPEVAAALALMEAELARDLDLATLAAAVHLSPKHFARLFKAVTGVPPMTYLQALRVSRARAVLAETHRPVAAIASDLGFADAAHLSRVFRRAYGTTPRDFRSGARSSGSRLPAAGGQTMTSTTSPSSGPTETEETHR
jgi:AraC-like DNA-binding protein